MFFRKYKILGSSLIVAACISIGFPSQASMTPMQNNYTLKGLSQHQQRETSAVIVLKTDILFPKRGMKDEKKLRKN